MSDKDQPMTAPAGATAKWAEEAAVAIKAKERECAQRGDSLDLADIRPIVLRALDAARAERLHTIHLAERGDVGVWCWQGDGEDHPESLTCPILISAEDMRELLAKGATAPAGAPAKVQAADVIRQLDEQRAAPGRLGMLTIDGSFEDKWWPLYGETLVRGLLSELDAARAEGASDPTSADVRKALAIVAEGRDSHQQWADYLAKAAKCDCHDCRKYVAETRELVQDEAHQREWVAKYDHLAKVLRGVEAAEARAAQAEQERDEARTALEWERQNSAKQQNTNFTLMAEKAEAAARTARYREALEPDDLRSWADCIQSAQVDIETRGTSEHARLNASNKLNIQKLLRRAADRLDAALKEQP